MNTEIYWQNNCNIYYPCALCLFSIYRYICYCSFSVLRHSECYELCSLFVVR